MLLRQKNTEFLNAIEMVAQKIFEIAGRRR